MADAYELRVMECKLSRDNHPLWLLALFEPIQARGTFYYAPLVLSVTGSLALPEPKAEKRAKPAEANILCDELIATISRPHMDGPNGFKEVMAGMPRRENAEYVADALFRLERAFLVPTGTWASWKSRLAISNLSSSGASPIRGSSSEILSPRSSRHLPTRRRSPPAPSSRLTPADTKSKQSSAPRTPASNPKMPAHPEKSQPPRQGSCPQLEGQASASATHPPAGSSPPTEGQSPRGAPARPSSAAPLASRSVLSDIPLGGGARFVPFKLRREGSAQSEEMPPPRLDLSMRRVQRFGDLKGPHEEQD